MHNKGKVIPLEEEDVSRRRLIPVTAWEDFHPWPSVRGLRHLILHAEEKGFDKVIRRVGGRILIDEQAFFAWVDEQDRNAA